jgi:hypothetical protein
MNENKLSKIMNDEVVAKIILNMASASYLSDNKPFLDAWFQDKEESEIQEVIMDNIWYPFESYEADDILCFIEDSQLFIENRFIVFLTHLAEKNYITINV